MSKQTPVYLHTFWHQHQPWYLDPGSNTGVMPWVRLHGVKDYYDMAELSQRFDGWKQTINLVPSLLDQLIMYVDGTMTDSTLELSRKPAEELSPEEKITVLTRFFDAHPPRMIHPYPRYDELFRKRGRSISDAVKRFSVQDFRDLQVWHNLVWIDPMWYESPQSPLFDLIEKQKGFSEEDKHLVLDHQIKILGKIIPLHKKLYQAGRLELTCSPYYHPILPLLCDSSIALVSNPHDPIPQPPFKHPEDAEWHIHHGIKRFEEIFGSRPNGMWPSEGSVSDQACSMIVQEGITFFATDEGVLFNSSFINKGTQPDRTELFRLHRLTTENGDIDCVFRDHGLSDLIGFIYQGMDAKEAAQDFIKKLKDIGNEWTDTVPPLVSVILDGENCWEFYHRDGHDFLKYLIEGILKDPQIQPTTVPEYREVYPPEPTLDSIHPGSWINHNYRIWIGHPEDNAAWHFLRQARDMLVQKEATLDEATRNEAWKAIHICEGSDWCWWYGDEHSSIHEKLFDSQYRNYLARIYELIEVPIPESLKRPIKEEKKLRSGGGMLFHKPQFNGRPTGYYEWVGCRVIPTAEGGGAMHQVAMPQTELCYGRQKDLLCFMIEFKDGIQNKNPRFSLQITKPFVKSIQLLPISEGSEVVLKNNRIEGSVDLAQAEITPEKEVWFFFQLEQEEEPSLSIPSGYELYLQGYTLANASIYWFL